MSKAISTEQSAEVARAYIDALGTGKVDEACAMWRAGGVDDLVGIATLRAPEEVYDFFAAVHQAVPDLGHEIIAVTAHDDRAVVHWRMFGTFDGTGKMIGLAPNGRRFEILGHDMFTVRDGKIVSNVAISNGLEIARQLGIMPPQDSPLEKAMYALVNLVAPLAKRIRARRSSR